MRNRIDLVHSGIECRLERVDAAVTEDELCARVQAICDDNAIHGVIVQLPLPPHINEKRVLGMLTASFFSIADTHPRLAPQILFRSAKILMDFIRSIWVKSPCAITRPALRHARPRVS